MITKQKKRTYKKINLQQVTKNANLVVHEIQRRNPLLKEIKFPKKFSKETAVDFQFQCAIFHYAHTFRLRYQWHQLKYCAQINRLNNF